MALPIDWRAQALIADAGERLESLGHIIEVPVDEVLVGDREEVPPPPPTGGKGLGH